MTIGIIVALDKELELLRNVFDCTSCEAGDATYYEGTSMGHRVVLVHSGIGKVNAAIGTSALLARYSPDAVINTGVAGGASKSVSVMDIVAAERTAYHDVWCGFDTEWGRVQGLPKFFEAAPMLLDALPEHPHLKRGLTCTGDRFIDSIDEVEAIRKNYPDVLAVDMESAAMAHVCHRKGVPFLSLRVISDSPGASNDNWQEYTDFWTDAPKQSLGVVKALVERLVAQR